MPSLPLSGTSYRATIVTSLSRRMRSAIPQTLRCKGTFDRPYRYREGDALPCRSRDFSYRATIVTPLSGRMRSCDATSNTEVRRCLSIVPSASGTVVPSLPLPGTSYRASIQRPGTDALLRCWSPFEPLYGNPGYSDAINSSLCIVAIG
jgi:hypothetical protein